SNVLWKLTVFLVWNSGLGRGIPETMMELVMYRPPLGDKIMPKRVASFFHMTLVACLFNASPRAEASEPSILKPASRDVVHFALASLATAPDGIPGSIGRLRERYGRLTVPTILAATRHSDEMVRRGAVRALPYL